MSLSCSVTVSMGEAAKPLLFAVSKQVSNLKSFCVAGVALPDILHVLKVPKSFCVTGANAGFSEDVLHFCVAGAALWRPPSSFCVAGAAL